MFCTPHGLFAGKTPTLPDDERGTMRAMRYWPSLFLLPPLLLLLLWQWADTSLTRPAELADPGQLSGFEAAETSPYGSFRWSGAQARLNLSGSGLPGTLTLYGAIAPATTLASVRPHLSTLQPWVRNQNSAATSCSYLPPLILLVELSSS